QSVDLEKKDEVQDDAVGCDGTGDRIDRHGAKGVRYLRCHGGAAAFQRCFDQPAKRQALRRRRGLSVVGDLRLEPGNGFLAGDIGEHSLDIPGNGHLQLRAAFQLGEGRVEQGAPPLEELAYALLVGHPRAELYRQNRRRSHELLDHLLMGDEQVAQIFAAAVACTDFQHAVVVFLLQAVAVDGTRQQNLLGVAALALRLDGQEGIALLDFDLVLASARQLHGDHDFAALVEHVDKRLVHVVDDDSLRGGMDVAEPLDAGGALAAAAGADAESIDAARPIAEALEREFVLVLQVFDSGLGQLAEQVDGVPQRAEQPAELDLESFLGTAAWIGALLHHHSSPGIELVALCRRRSEGPPLDDATAMPPRRFEQADRKAAMPAPTFTNLVAVARERSSQMMSSHSRRARSFSSRAKRVAICWRAHGFAPLASVCSVAMLCRPPSALRRLFLARWSGMCRLRVRAADRRAGRAMMLDKAQQHLVLLHALGVGLSVEQGFRAKDVETYLHKMRVVDGRPKPLLRDHATDHDAAA